jgi:hypothetical protein
MKLFLGDYYMENENRELEEISEVSDDYEENGLSLSRGRD